MKITIEPSPATIKDESIKFRRELTASIDTNMCDEGTDEVVQAALACIIAIGHDPVNVMEAAENCRRVMLPSPPPDA